MQKLEASLGTQLFRRTSREVRLTAAGRVLLDEAPAALAALARAAERTREAGADAATTLRLGYTPVAGFDTLPTLFEAAARDCPDVTVVAREQFSAATTDRLVAGDLDVGVALEPQPHVRVRSEILRVEPVSALLSRSHRLAGTGPVELDDLRDETLLLFPRRLAPDYYDRIVGSCERAGFVPRVQTFEDPPASAMIARLTGGREIGLTPASFASHAAEASPGLVAREIADRAILAEFSILWPARDPSPAVARFLDSARACAAAKGWLSRRVGGDGDLSPRAARGPASA